MLFLIIIFLNDMFFQTKGETPQKEYMTQGYYRRKDRKRDCNHRKKSINAKNLNVTKYF